MLELIRSIFKFSLSPFEFNLSLFKFLLSSLKSSQSQLKISLHPCEFVLRLGTGLPRLFNVFHCFILHVHFTSFTFLGSCFFNRCLDQAHFRMYNFEDPFIDRTTDDQVLN